MKITSNKINGNHIQFMAMRRHPTIQSSRPRVLQLVGRGGSLYITACILQEAGLVPCFLVSCYPQGQVLTTSWTDSRNLGPPLLQEAGLVPCFLVSCYALGQILTTSRGDSLNLPPPQEIIEVSTNGRQNFATLEDHKKLPQGHQRPPKITPKSRPVESHFRFDDKHEI